MSRYVLGLFVCIAVISHSNRTHASDEPHRVWVEFDLPEGLIYKIDENSVITEECYKNAWTIQQGSDGKKWISLIPHTILVNGYKMELKSDNDPEDPHIGLLLAPGNYTIDSFDICDRYGKQFETKTIQFKASSRHDLIVVQLDELMSIVPTNTILTHSRFCLVGSKQAGCVEGNVYPGNYKIAYKPGQYKKSNKPCTVQFGSECTSQDRELFARSGRLKVCRDRTVILSCTKEMHGAVSGMLVLKDEKFGPEPLRVYKNSAHNIFTVGQQIKIEPGGYVYRFETLEK